MAIGTSSRALLAGWLSLAASQDRPRTSYRDDLVTVGVGMWLTLGVFVDGWAHNTRGDTLESFFTPWHALFYSGFIACAAWIGWLIGRQRGQGRLGMAAIPIGYELGALGVVIFGFGGLGDMIWHTVFGIEVDLKALLSPTHLMLFLGAFLILTCPLRAGWATYSSAPTLKALLPALLSMLAAACFVYFMGMFLWAPLDAFYADNVGELARRYGPDAARRIVRVDEAYGVTEVLLTNALLLGPILLLMRRWRLPFGSATILFGVSSLLMQAVDGMRSPEQVLIALATGLIGDCLIGALRATPERDGPFRVIGAIVPLVFWSLYFLAGQVVLGIRWAPEIWTGSIVLAMLSGVGLSVLAAPPSIPVSGGVED
ncbi:MAG TPA: hypothetical protein VGL99_10410 [Chloroflexota bacterium]